MDKKIISFIKYQTCASICCVDETGKPYCFSCFYAFDPIEGILYFKSSITSRHAELMKKNIAVAGTILPDKLNKIFIKGIQFQGIVLDIQHPYKERTMGIYLLKYPLTLAIPGDMWALQIDQIKMTDSTIGFGQKICWKRSELVSEI